MAPAHRTGFVALVGRPNVGKSTLLNALVGQKLAIVTPLPQTTRERILAIKNVAGAQIVFLDTPGLHARKGPLHALMRERAQGAIRDADVILLLTEATAGAPSKEGEVLAAIAGVQAPVLLVLTKVDRLKDKRALLPQIERLRALFAFDAVVPTSARTGLGCQELVDETVARLPESPPLYPEDVLTDRSERFFAAELVREQIVRETRAELPYAVAVTIDSFEEPGSPASEARWGGEGPPMTRIRATIHVDRPSQKAIVIGRGGARLKSIGTEARKEIEELVGGRVHLELWVRVSPGWTKDPAQVEQLVGGA